MTQKRSPLKESAGGQTFGAFLRYVQSTTQQWIAAGYQLQQSVKHLPAEPERQLEVAQELVCLLAYIGGRSLGWRLVQF